jgi:hypothetical protein
METYLLVQFLLAQPQAPDAVLSFSMLAPHTHCWAQGSGTGWVWFSAES